MVLYCLLDLNTPLEVPLDPPIVRTQMSRTETLSKRSRFGVRFRLYDRVRSNPAPIPLDVGSGRSLHVISSAGVQ